MKVFFKMCRFAAKRLFFILQSIFDEKLLKKLFEPHIFTIGVPKRSLVGEMSL